MHVQEVFVLYGALAMLYVAKGEDDAARSLVSSLESMVEDEDDERRLAQVKRLVARLDPQERFKEVLATLLKTGTEPGKPRR